MSDPDWLFVRSSAAPLMLTFPQGGANIAPAIEARLASSWLGRKDTDWYIAQLYACADGLDATPVATRMSHTVPDDTRAAPIRATLMQLLTNYSQVLERLDRA